MSNNDMRKILVTGAVGQIGSELTMALRAKFGSDSVVAAGHKTQPSRALRESGPFEFIEVAKSETLEHVVDKYDIDTIYHMAALLSIMCEERPQLAWEVNINGLYNILEIARERELVRVFCPSSIAAFGPETPQDNTPQETIVRPRTMYGVSKAAGELLCDYYVRRFGVDVRGIRYPGIISNETLPGGGVTDYAVDIHYKAVEDGHYTCFLRPDTVIPMMYMPDCVKGTIDLMDADFNQLEHHADFNMAAMSFCPTELVAEIQRHLPAFKCDYEPDFRQDIADSWPRSIDDSAARAEWGWEPSYDLAAMTADMLEKLGQRHREGRLYPK